MWNNQLELLAAGKLEMFNHPACFIEFSSAEIQQLGNGVQLFNPLKFKVHILDWQIDAMDGTFEQNLEVYDLKDVIYQALQKLQPGLLNQDTPQNIPVSEFIRIAEWQDYQHAGVYHYIQEYSTTLIDNNALEPVGGSDWTPVGDPPLDVMPLELDVTIQDSEDPAEPYVFNFTPSL